MKDQPARREILRSEKVRAMGSGLDNLTFNPIIRLSNPDPTDFPLNSAYYGKAVTPKDIIVMKDVGNSGANELRSALEKALAR